MVSLSPGTVVRIANPGLRTRLLLKEGAAGADGATGLPGNGVVPANRFVLLGASKTAENGVGVGTQDAPGANVYTHAFGDYSWANALLGGRLTLVKNLGIGGQTTAQILARVGDATALDVDFCLLSDTCINSIATDVATASIIADLDQIIDALLDAKIRPVISTVAPTGSWTTSGRKAAVAAINAHINALAQLPGVIVYDPASAITDPTTGLGRAGYLRDGTHNSNLAGQACGFVLANALRPYVVGAVDLVTSAADPTTLSANPMCTGTAGTLGTGVTGQVATSWSVAAAIAGNAVASKVARDDGLGEWQQIKMTGAGEYWFQQLFFGGRPLTAGVKLRLECEIEADDDWTSITKVLAYIDSSGAKTSIDLNETEIAPPPQNLKTVASMVLRTPILTVGAAATYCAANIVVAGSSGTVRIGRARLKEVA